MKSIVRGLLTALLSLSVAPLFAQSEFIRGDCNADGFSDVADVVFLTRFLVQGGSIPDCLAACDAEVDDGLNLVDGIVLINHLYFAVPPTLPSPFPDCGPDPDPAGLSCLSYDCDPPPMPTPDPGLLLTFTDANGVSGGTADVACLLDSSGGCIVEGWSWGVCHDDASVVNIQDVAYGLDTATVNNGDPPDFGAQTLFPDAGWTTAVVISFAGLANLQPGFELEMHVATYELITGGFAEVLYCDTLGASPVPVVLVEEGEGVLPTTLPGTIGVAGAGEPFVRGDADNSGGFNGLVDGLFILNFQFVPGSPPPPCLDAADFDDDGNFNGIIDGLGALNFQFVPGSSPPPPPGAQDCGIDPTVDDIGGDVTACP